MCSLLIHPYRKQTVQWQSHLWWAPASAHLPASFPSLISTGRSTLQEIKSPVFSTFLCRCNNIGPCKHVSEADDVGGVDFLFYVFYFKSSTGFHSWSMSFSSHPFPISCCPVFWKINSHSTNKSSRLLWTQARVWVLFSRIDLENRLATGKPNVQAWSVEAGPFISHL